MAGSWLVLLVLMAGAPASFPNPTEVPHPLPVLTVEGDPRPGGALFLTLSGGIGDGSIRGTWRKLRFPFVREGGREGADRWRAIIPVERHTTAGSYPLVIQLPGPDDGRTLSREIRILPRWFGRQFLHLPRRQADTYEDPALEAEYALIDQVLTTVSTDRLPAMPLRWPVSAPVTTNYGISRFVNGEPAGWHRGIDLGADRATPVRAPAAGRVILAHRGLKIHGNTVILDHGAGLLTAYLHLDRIAVRVEEEVLHGTVLGTVGATGIATGPHLHWGVYLHGVPVDPGVLTSFPASWRRSAAR